LKLRTKNNFRDKDICSRSNLVLVEMEEG
jgi:hypothetical protein